MTRSDFDDLAYRCRKLIARVALASELNVLANQLTRIALSKRHTCDFTLNSLRDALTEVVANFPVYRTYVTPCGVSENDAGYIRRAIASAKWRSPAADSSIFDFIGEVLLTRIAEEQDSAYRNAVTSFAMKFQQFTSPVMAKGLEDTAFYRYNRLVSLNDVGSDLQRFGITTAEFPLGESGTSPLLAAHHAGHQYPRLQALRGCARADRCALRDIGTMEASSAGLETLQSAPQVAGERQARPVAKRRILALPDVGGRLAGRAFRAARTTGSFSVSASKITC